ncbi:MAG TPA: sulfatase [Bryobacteraceae bacterium]|jgi:arylsulfatase|nr:sulfatase [Bryobacteraceae bacterium]
MIDRRSFLAFVGGTLAAATSRPPNIVFILCDDLGYGDLGCYGSKIRTPNLDRMASDGVRFTNFCAADPVCSPSRAALLTGRYPTRVGVPKVFFPDDTNGLNLDETTLADLLKARNYKTMCIGKWHLGRPAEYLPTRRGFDEYFGIPYSNDMKPRVLMHNAEVIEQSADLDSLTGRYTEQALRFIHENRASPFFLYMPHTFPHIPLGASARFRGKSPEGLYGDVVEELDWSVGQIRQALKENGLEQNTLIAFTSDNGPWYQGSPGKLRGRKNTTYEGGVREPFLAAWPGKIPKGHVCNGLASMLDILPTVTALCGAGKPSKPLDGIDILAMLEGRKDSIDREILLYFDAWDLQCARWMSWKLHIARHNTAAYAPPPAGGRLSFTLARPELYNLATDADESYDVAPENPQIVTEMLRRIDALLPGFPEPVQKAWAEAKARKSAPEVPAGGYARPAQ